MKYLLIFLIVLTPLYSCAQSDTLFVKFENNFTNSEVYYRSVRNKKDTGSVYPFDGGTMYIFKKRRIIIPKS